MITSFFTTKTNKRKPTETQADREPQEKKFEIWLGTPHRPLEILCL